MRQSLARRLTRFPASAASPPPCPRCPASEKLKVVGFVSNLVGGRSWSQVTWMPNLVQIVQEMKKFLGLLNFSPGRSDSGFPASAASPPPCPRCPASEKLKVVGFVSNLVGGRSWSQVTWMPNLVQIVQEMKKFLGLLNFSPGRSDSGFPASAASPPPCPRCPASEKLKVVGFVSNLTGGRSWSQVTCMPTLVQIVQEIKKFWGLRFSPGRAGSGRVKGAAGWERRLAGPLVPGSVLAKISKSSDLDQIRCAGRWARGGGADGVLAPCYARGPSHGRLFPEGGPHARDYVPRLGTWRQVRKVEPLQQFLRYRLG